MALTREQLDHMGCSNPGCTHGDGADCQMFVHARCHLHAAVTVSYSKQSGALTIRCARCSQFVADIEVARHANV